MRRCAVGLLALAWLSSPGSARAQAALELSVDAPITLRPTPATRELARAVARTLGVRLDVPVAVGEDAPPEILEAVPAGHLAIGREAQDVILILAGPEGQVYHSRVAVGEGSGTGVVRAVALAAEALRDAAIDGPPPGIESMRTYTRDGREVTWTYVERAGGLFGERPVIEALAKPTITIGFLAGLSTERNTVLVGPRLGLGLCLDRTCVVIEGDLPVLPEESTACDGRGIEYRPVNLSLRVQLRPFEIGDVAFAFDFGILSRFGLANLVGVDVSRVATDFGLRNGIEVSWRFAAPVELVFEIGSDIHTSPAVFVRTARPPPGVPDVCGVDVERILVEDLVTVWGMLAIRLRP